MYCGYGKIYTGSVTVSGSGDTNNYYTDEDSSSDDSSEDSSSEDYYDVVTDKNIPFVYSSGCLSEDETMTFDDY